MQRPFARWSARLLLDLLGNALDELTEGLHLADEKCDLEAWEDTKYNPNRLNLKDRIVCLAEDIGYDLAELLKNEGFTNRMNPYLESDVRRVLEPIEKSR